MVRAVWVLPAPSRPVHFTLWLGGSETRRLLLHTGSNARSLFGEKQGSLPEPADRKRTRTGQLRLLQQGNMLASVDKAEGLP